MVNNAWDLVPLPKGIKHVRFKWVYITNYVSNGSVEILKVRLFSKGSTQV